MRPIRILHISDLHERAYHASMPGWRKQQVRLDREERGLVLGTAFEEALREAAPEGVDLILCTGDVADWGHPAEYEAAAHRIQRIMATVGVGADRFFAVPGNHDVQRNTSPEAWSKVREWFARTRDRRGLGKWMRQVGSAPPGLENAWRDQLLARTDAFWTFLDELGCCNPRPHAPNLLGYRHELVMATTSGAFKMQLVGLDSAWLCGADDDQGRILLTDQQILAHLRSEEDALDGFIVVMLHHPLDHLADHVPARRLLSTCGVDLVLHGHQHHPVATTTFEPDSELRIVASSCLLEGDRGRDWGNGFSIIEVDPERRSGSIHFRRWSGEFWTVGSDVYRSTEDGTVHWNWDEPPGADDDWLSGLIDQAVVTGIDVDSAHSSADPEEMLAWERRIRHLCATANVASLRRLARTSTSQVARGTLNQIASSVEDGDWPPGLPETLVHLKTARGTLELLIQLGRANASHELVLHPNDPRELSDGVVVEFVHGADGSSFRLYTDADGPLVGTTARVLSGLRAISALIFPRSSTDKLGGESVVVLDVPLNDENSETI